MSKYIVGTAAILALALSGVQTWRMSVLSQELSELREKADTVALQEKVGTLEKELGETRGEAAALKANLGIRTEELVQIDRRLRGFEQNYGGVPKAAAQAEQEAAKRVQAQAGYRKGVEAMNWLIAFPDQAVPEKPAPQKNEDALVFRVFDDTHHVPEKPAPQKNEDKF